MAAAGLALALIALLAGLAAFALNGPTASAQSAELVLVRNNHTTVAGNIDITKDRGISFRTGSNAGGYVLSSVDLFMEVGNPNGTYPTYTVELYSDIASDTEPIVSLATLTNPDSLITGANRFTKPGGYLLAPDTKYFIAFLVSDNTGANINARLRTTASDDQLGEPGWTIDNAYRYKERTDAIFNDVSAANRALQLRVNGYTDFDTTLPRFRSAAVELRTLTIDFNKALDPGSVPAAGAFTVKIKPGFDGPEEETIAVSGVEISGSTVTLTLASSSLHGRTVTVSYTPPDSHPLQDVIGQYVTEFTDRRVTNNAPPRGGTAEIPRLKLVRGPFVRGFYDSEGRYTRGHFPFLRDEHGNLVFERRTDPNRPCVSASWIESLGQWACTADGEPAPGTAISRRIVREYDPDSGTYALKRYPNGNFVTVLRPDPNHPCASATWAQSLGQWVCAYDTYVEPSDSQQTGGGTPVVHPVDSGAIIPHRGQAECIPWSLNGRPVTTCE
ncbi:MAG: hypothetical protein F4066_00715 [Chloroflexi bacterium]|nr:hypothetical protein [Chloroflexota bacterium]